MIFCEKTRGTKGVPPECRGVTEVEKDKAERSTRIEAILPLRDTSCSHVKIRNKDPTVRRTE